MGSGKLKSTSEMLDCGKRRSVVAGVISVPEEDPVSMIN